MKLQYVNFNADGEEYIRDYDLTVTTLRSCLYKKTTKGGVVYLVKPDQKIELTWKLLIECITNL